MILEAATCLALTVYHEARGEPIEGQLAVAEVVLTRTYSHQWPNTICGVMQEDRGPKAYDCQFSFWCDGRSDTPTDSEAWATAQQIARDALSGNIIGHGGTHYHTTDVSPSWAAEMQFRGIVGSHVFYNDGTCALPACSPVPKHRPKKLK
jgi:spore germination cell wall hydrolase CwlJ-like protein